MDLATAETLLARPPRCREALRIAIVGAGFGGLGMAIALKRAGFSNLMLFERAASLGGTWRDNTYPGAACDVPSHLYSFSFAPKPDWTARYASQQEILDYLADTAERSGIGPHIQLNTPVTAATWERHGWRVETADGRSEMFDVLISAVGQLSHPVIPDFPGLAEFRGAHFHSAQWDHAVPLAGKRIALIGAAASAVQIAPQLAPVTAHLAVFQRTPNWIIPRLNGAYGARRHRLFTHLPWLRRAFRFALWQYQELLFGAFRSGSRRNALMRRLSRAHLARQVADPALRRKLTPDFAIGCKRVLVADDYYPIFNRPNVSLVTETIAGFEAAGIRTNDGVVHPADVAIFATGFDVRHSVAMEVTGNRGISLRSRWQGGPEAWRGIAIPGFPNFFLLYGPNTNLGHNSIILMLEAQSRAIVACLERLVARDLDALEISEAAHERYNAELQGALARTVWTSGCQSWYGEGGRITANWSGSTLDYIRMMRRVPFGDFV